MIALEYGKQSRGQYDHSSISSDRVGSLLSPEQKPNKVIGNILHCLEFGCQLGWFLDPDDRSLLLFQPNQQPKLCQGNDRLAVPTWIALELTANQVFGWLKMVAE